MSELKPVAQSKSSNNNNDQRVMAWLVATNSKCDGSAQQKRQTKKTWHGEKNTARNETGDS